MKQTVLIFLLYFMYLHRVYCGTDELVHELLRRVDALEKQGEEQRQRLHQLEEEVLELKDRRCDCTKLSLTTTVGTDDDDDGGGGDGGAVTEDILSGIKTKGSQLDGEAQSSGIKSPSLLQRTAPRLQDAAFLKRFVVNTEYVAFHARLAASLGSSNSIGQILIFDTTTLNVGEAYNNLTGIFIAPIDGIYIFSTSLCGGKSPDGQNHVDIMKNGQEMGAAYSTGTGSLDQGSVTVVMQLSVGDEVHVSTQRHEDISIYGDKLTSFTGCLIIPL